MTIRRRGRRPAGDDGFSLLETLVSISMISVVMAGLTMFYVRSNVATALQAQAQAANQIASAAMEQVSLLPGDALLTGRPACLMSAQWAQTSPPVPQGASRFFASMTPAGDTRLANLVCPVGAALQTMLTSTTQLAGEALPTLQTVKSMLNQVPVTFTKSFYVGLCWQTRGNGDACVKPTAGNVPATVIPMLRIVIAVTWQSARCPKNSDNVYRCAYVTDTLVNRDILDPTFS